MIQVAPRTPVRPAAWSASHMGMWIGRVECCIGVKVIGHPIIITALSDLPLEAGHIKHLQYCKYLSNTHTPHKILE